MKVMMNKNTMWWAQGYWTKKLLNILSNFTTIQLSESQKTNMNKVVINGNTVSGNFAADNLIIINGKVFVNGKDVTPDAKEINITIQGSVEKLEVDACSKITIDGDVHNVTTKSGDVDISGNVSGNVQTMSG
jgi:cytoskeletal protein CcmA (bactofilin family)